MKRFSLRKNGNGCVKSQSDNCEILFSAAVGLLLTGIISVTQKIILIWMEMVSLARFIVHRLNRISASCLFLGAEMGKTKNNFRLPSSRRRVQHYKNELNRKSELIEKTLVACFGVNGVE